MYEYIVHFILREKLVPEPEFEPLLSSFKCWKSVVYELFFLKVFMVSKLLESLVVWRCNSTFLCSASLIPRFSRRLSKLNAVIAEILCGHATISCTTYRVSEYRFFIATLSNSTYCQPRKSPNILLFMKASSDNDSLHVQANHQISTDNHYNVLQE